MRAAAASLGAIALLAIGAAPASATVTVRSVPSESRGLVVSVSGSGSDLRVTAEINGSGQTTAVVVRDESGSPAFQPQGSCQQQTSPFSNQVSVRCTAPMLPFVEFSGDATRRDSLDLTVGTGSCVCNGNGGDDRIVGAEGADFIDGGPGADVLRGGSDNDVLEGRDGADNISGGLGNDTERGAAGDDEFVTGTGSDGADTFAGGDGRDTVNYGPRTSRVDASTDGVPNDGTLFRVGREEDNIGNNVENVTGGAGGDLLVGNSNANNLFGGGGDDTIRGGSNEDTLDGGLGSDLLQGDDGSDLIRARDSVDDQVRGAISCGAGFDTLDADVRDDDTRAIQLNCDSVSQGMVGELPNVRIRSVRRSGGRTLKVRLQCPRRTRNGCRGRLSAASPRKRARFGRSKRYRIRRGRSQVVRILVRRSSQARRGGRVRIRSVEKGRLGRRTTFKTLRVRR